MKNLQQVLSPTLELYQTYLFIYLCYCIFKRFGFWMPAVKYK